MSARIPPTDVSVIVQGPIVGPGSGNPARGSTRESLASLRRWLPGAEVIVSTWAGSKTEGLNADRVVVSDDPGGAAVLSHELLPNNINRQIVSTAAGLAVATRPYALKFRGDHILIGNGFLRAPLRYPKRAPEFRLLQERVTVHDHYSQNPRRGGFPLGSPSDLAQFGRIEDLRRIWSAPLVRGLPADVTETERAALGAQQHATRLVPEQYLLAHLAPELNLTRHDDDNPALREAVERTLANNFIIWPRRAFGIWSRKYWIQIDVWAGLFTRRDWEELYQRYCDPGATPGFDLASHVKDFCYPPGRAATLPGRVLRATLRRNLWLTDWL